MVGAEISTIEGVGAKGIEGLVGGVEEVVVMGLIAMEVVVGIKTEGATDSRAMDSSGISNHSSSSSSRDSIWSLRKLQFQKRTHI